MDRLPGAIDADKHHVAVVSIFLAEDLQTTTAVSFRGIFQQVAAKCSGVTPLLCADCSTVQDRLSKVQQLQATERAFAAILADGLVTTWGDRD